MRPLLATFILLAAIVFSCCNEKKLVETPKEGTEKILAIIVKRDSTRILEVVIRQIAKRVKYDSTKGKDVVAIDTLWGIPIAVPLLDSLNHPVIDSLTKKPKVNPQPQYVLWNKDSILTHVENVSYDSLIKKR